MIDENSHSGLGSNGMIPVAQRVQRNMRWLQMGVVFSAKFIDLKLFQSPVQPWCKLDHFAFGLIGKYGLHIIHIWITCNLPLFHFTQLRGWVCIIPLFCPLLCILHLAFPHIPVPRQYEGWIIDNLGHQACVAHHKVDGRLFFHLRKI